MTIENQKNKHMKTVFRILKYLGIFLVVILLTIGGIFMYRWRDRHPGYELDLDLRPPVSPTLSAGFSKKAITPTIVDTWNDANGDHKFNKDHGDTYNDINGNGKFDAYWIAGMSNAKPAQGVHDDVWARAVVFDDGTHRIALVSLDAIGYLHGDVIDIRQRIPDSLGIDYVVVASTHTHESNDLIGIWGKDIFHSGVDDAMSEYVKDQTVAAVVEAANSLRPAKLVFAEDLSGRDSVLMKDTRKPIVKATGLHLVQILDKETGTSLGSLVNWSNHPETLWNSNLLISSDFPHYVREAMENGVYDGDTLKVEGIGGTCIYFTGVIGGLMAPHPTIDIHDPFTGEAYGEPGFAKTKALGDQIALMGLDALRSHGDTVALGPISARAKTITLPLDNNMFKLAGGLGLIKMGLKGYFRVQSEVAAIRIGPAIMVCIPGELYPEIAFGGVEAPPGREFDIQPLETPPIDTFITDRYRFYLGLANDEIGYIIPKSEWDTKRPYLYLDERDTYGEGNSLGPETAPLIYSAILQTLSELNGTTSD